MNAPTAKSILDVAQDLCQRVGFNGFSYRDIASELGIKTSSIHYHYPTKGKLGEALLIRYRGEFTSALANLSAETRDPTKRIQRFGEVLGGALKDKNKLCLCVMLASELETIEPAMQTQVRSFFEDAERWLAGALSEGKESGAFAFEGSAAAVARSYLAALQGLAIWARAFNEPARFDAGRAWLAQGLVA